MMQLGLYHALNDVQDGFFAPLPEGDVQRLAHGEAALVGGLMPSVPSVAPLGGQFSKRLNSWLAHSGSGQSANGRLKERKWRASGRTDRFGSIWKDRWQWRHLARPSARSSRQRASETLLTCPSGCGPS